MEKFSQWGTRLFFSATVAFSVPSIYKDGGLLRPTPLWKGLMLTVAAVLGKLGVGFYAESPLTLAGFFKLGWAMNGRGEFSFFIAESAHDNDILTAEDYSAVVLALLLSSIMAPIGFRWTLKAYGQAGEEEIGVTTNGVEGEIRRGEVQGGADISGESEAPGVAADE